MAESDIVAQDGLQFAVILDTQGGAEVFDWTGLESWTPQRGPLWVHLEAGTRRVDRWLTREAGLAPIVCEALLAEETRPRTLQIGEGLLAILRGVNLNPGADPEDMVAVRIWVDANRIISVRHQRLLTPRDVLSQLLEGGHGPTSTSEVFAALASGLAARMNSVIADFDDRLDAMEAQVDDDRPSDLRTAISRLRHEGVALRRYLAPQRDALNQLLLNAPTFFGDGVRHSLRETTNQTLRYLEDLEAAKDRAVVILDEVSNKIAESMNRTMYVLSIVAAIFLPLSFVTGLLGINVGGMPGVDDTAAFAITCGLLVVLLVAEVLILRRLKWL